MQPSEPLLFISVVVATRNRAKLLRDCIESLVRQDLPASRYEIIVADDGSTDETPEVVSDLRGRIERPALRYVRPERRGLTVARNAGLGAALGDPIVFVDDDVLAPQTWLKAVAEGCLRHPEAGCLGGPVRLRLEGKPPRFCPRDPLGDTNVDLGTTERFVDSAAGANMALRRSAVEKVGLFNERLGAVGDEAEWESRLLRGGGRIIYLPEAGVWHRRTPEDLRLWHLVRVRFRQGRQAVLLAEVEGKRLSLGREIIGILRFLAHAAVRGCAGGLLSASASAGRVWGLVLAQRLDHADSLRSI